MSSASRNRARGRLKEVEQIPFEKVDAIRALQDVITCYLNPPDFKPGDLAQTREHFTAWEGFEAGDLAPVAVLAVCEDMAEVTEDPGLRGVRGIRVAMASADEGVAIMWEEAWHFEPYTGPRPDAH